MNKFLEALAAWCYGIVVLSPVLLIVVPIVVLVGVVLVSIIEKAVS